jgi:Large-conductance mechanosensitive channel, MscL
LARTIEQQTDVMIAASLQKSTKLFEHTSVPSVHCCNTGVAFGAIVTSLVSDIIMPLIGAITDVSFHRVQIVGKRGPAIATNPGEAADRAMRRSLPRCSPVP